MQKLSETLTFNNSATAQNAIFNFIANSIANFGVGYTVHVYNQDTGVTVAAKIDVANTLSSDETNPAWANLKSSANVNNGESHIFSCTEPVNYLRVHVTPSAAATGKVKAVIVLR